MVRPYFIAALAALLIGLMPAVAEARSQTLNINVQTAGSDTSAAGVKVEVSDMDGNKLGSGVTGADGNATITFEVPDGVDKVLIETDVQGQKGSDVTDLRGVAKDYSLGLLAGSRVASAADLAELARRASARCDKAAYDRWTGELDQAIASARSDVDERQRDAEEFARERNLRITDLAGARKDLKRAAAAQEKLDPALRNPETLHNLRTYIERLEELQSNKATLEALQKARREVPPFPEDCKKDKKVGLLPGQKACPDGSGGLLAGALNEMFDTDLDPACDDPNRRDTERPKKKKHDRHEQHRD